MKMLLNNTYFLLIEGGISKAKLSEGKRLLDTRLTNIHTIDTD
jgi:hypothetical protein